MRGNSYKKSKREPQIKIGSKKENIIFSEKTTDPTLNLFNKQLNIEEKLSKDRKQCAREEFSYLSKNYQDNYPGKPNLAHQRIDALNVAGKIGQERREEDIKKYQQQKSFTKDQVFSNYTNSDFNQKNYNYPPGSIINNAIFGFCDPAMKYPKTSYQSNYEGSDINENLKYLSQKQYEDYLKFRKEQTEMMNKGNLRNNLRELPPHLKNEIKSNRDLREKNYEKEKEQLIQEQRLLDQNQAICLNPSKYIPTPEEYEQYLQEQKNNAMKQIKQNSDERIDNNNINQMNNNYNKINNNNQENNNYNYDKNYQENNYYNKEKIPNNYPNQNPEFEHNEYNNNYSPEEMRYLQKQEEMRQYNKMNNPNIPPSQYKQYENSQMNYGNQIPNSYEEYQDLLRKEKMQQNNLNSKPKINYTNENIPISEEQIREYERQKAEEEYYKNIKKYEDIIHDNPEQKFKLPPPPFNYNNMNTLNQMSKDSQFSEVQGNVISKDNIVSPNPYSINNYSLGKSNLGSNPITHPINSYQFDYNRLNNPLIKNK